MAFVFDFALTATAKRSFYFVQKFDWKTNRCRLRWLRSLPHDCSSSVRISGVENDWYPIGIALLQHHSTNVATWTVLTFSTRLLRKPSILIDSHLMLWLFRNGYQIDLNSCCAGNDVSTDERRIHFFHSSSMHNTSKIIIIYWVRCGVT